MKVGIACFPTYGGSGVVATTLASSLAARGHMVHLFSYAFPIRMNCFSERLFFHEVEDFRSPALAQSFYTLDLAAKIVSVARTEGLDLLHAHYAIPHSIAGLLARDIVGRRRLKVVSTLHGTDITLVGSDPAYAPLVKRAIEASDAVTLVSRDLSQQTRKRFSIRRPMEVTPNFIDAAAFAPKPAGGPPRHFTIAHLSNFRPLKRVSDVVQVFSRVSRDPAGRGARLVMAGDGPDRQKAERLARELDLASRVRFLGQQDSVAEIFAQADLLLLASAMESFGLAALEAMACELPVVATDAGGIREVVVDGRTGYLEPVGDIEAMAQRCLELARDRALRLRMGRAGRKRALSRFSIDAGVRRYERLYKKVMSPKS